MPGCHLVIWILSITPLFGGRRKRFSDSAEFSLTHCLVQQWFATPWLVGYMGGIGSCLLILLQFRAQWSQVHNPFHSFRSLICLHRCIDMAEVLLPVFFTSESNLLLVSSFPICQNSGKLRSIWVEHVRYQLPVTAEFASRTFHLLPLSFFFPLYRFDSVWLLLSSLCVCMSFIRACMILHANSLFAFQELLCHAT